ncbi:leucyl/phenylalanyl-tRNA--protein transferase [Massilia sp. TWR1-2-2]|uniref:leucyl/phenylalanyl-tRNA--protein transferase n=1 Tax=Massilia sp. TWR1-2-2 TaxID=2804584 RepID=UPI003CF5B150
MIPWLETNTPFPDVSHALTIDAPGLLAAGADLSPQRLLIAYQHGIFPWFSEGQPILWWSTDPRMVLRTDQFRVSDSLKKTLRRVERSVQEGGRWQVRFDSAFEGVMRACAAPRRDGPGTWISTDIIDGYTGLHAMGYGHSSELWLDGELVGGAYGVCIGRMFYGESMFARVTDGSKIALAYLVAFLRSHGVAMIDCQQQTGHLASLGAAPISRAEFLEHLRAAIREPGISNWQPVPALTAAR